MNYRLYSFVNFYLSSIQQGVQTAHLVAEMFSNTPTNSVQSLPLSHWARNDKTIIILNGGAAKDINETLALLTTAAETASWPATVGSFSEDVDSLNGTMTCCGVIVPEYIWGAVDYKTALRTEIIGPEFSFVPTGYIFKNSFGHIKTFEEGTADHSIISLIKSCGLAR